MNLALYIERCFPHIKILCNPLYHNKWAYMNISGNGLFQVCLTRVKKHFTVTNINLFYNKAAFIPHSHIELCTKFI